ncbi:HlyD family type I secretion periplasmic adaptor subunit [Pandoraea sp. LA3]|uniref:HlyD family type I secretion periplasmic adaptor subunit n=1 Tax=Pandoraea TaxID=93217 RepID=UPI00324206F1
MRHQLDAKERPTDELQFLPANLELIETPPHPIPKWTMRLVCLLAVAVLLTAIVGRLDIVATAKGKLIPSDRVKIIQPAITGVVRRIDVRDGQRVTGGQSLVVLDATQAAADAHKAKTSKVDAALTAARARALLISVKAGTHPQLEPVDDASETQQREAQSFANGSFDEYVNKLSSARAELDRRQAELATNLRVLEKLSATAPLMRQEANDYRELARDRYVSQHDYLEKERAAIEREHELAAQKSHCRELSSAVTQQQSIVAQTVAQFRREQLDELDKATHQFTQNQDDQTKAETRQNLLTLSAPVDGTVQQLAVHTVGGVVTTAQALMEIVPDDAIEVEANVENKDIGFVKEGQIAVVKFDAFPYTRYGFMEGRVISVSNDAVQDKGRKGEMTFLARIKLPSGHMKVDGKSINLTPGMSAVVEIKTGRRSVIGYFMEPLLQHADESLHER